MASPRNSPIRITAELEPLDAASIAGYSAEWRQAFGSITDATFETPPVVGPVRSKPLGPSR